MSHRSQLAAVLAGIAAACASAPALASHVGEEVTVDAQASSANDQLLGALKSWRGAPQAQRPAQMEQLLRRAQTRQERLLELLERNPKLAALRVLPAGLRQTFPAEARAWLEQDTGGEGRVFATVADDFQRGRSAKRFYFQPQAPGAAALEIQLANGGERELLAVTGRRVRLAKGTRIAARLLVDGQGDLVPLDGTTVAADGSVVPTTPVVQGAQKTLVILANFSDKALSCSAADVNTRVFASTGSSVNTSFRESSRNLVSFNGQVVGPFTINYTSTGSCDYSGWGAAAEAAARAAGVDPSTFQRVNYVTPSNGSCGWAGLAYMPGRTSWVQSCGATGVYTHELGHNLKLHHAGTPTAEYGDSSDPMGGARNVRNNAANQVMAGWVPTGGLIDVSANGSYTINALGGEAGTTPQVLRLRKADSNEWYYVSVRQAIGLDAALPAASLNAVAVHRASGTLPAKTTLLATLAAGQSYNDATNGITLTNQGVAGSTATVGVSVAGGSCTRAAPTVTVSPASQTGAPGAALAYSVSVRNNNSSACGSGNFALAPTLPAGFSGSLSTSTLALGAGATGNANWSVVSSASTAEGSFTLDLTAGESGGTTVVVHAAYVVAAPPPPPPGDTSAPTIGTVTPANGSVLAGGKTTISAGVSDNVGVARVEFYGNGRLLATDTSAPYSVNWNLRRVPKGATTIEVRAFDAAGNRAVRVHAVTIH